MASFIVPVVGAAAELASSGLSASLLMLLVGATQGSVEKSKLSLLFVGPDRGIGGCSTGLLGLSQVQLRLHSPIRRPVTVTERGAPIAARYIAKWVLSRVANEVTLQTKVAT